MSYVLTLRAPQPKNSFVYFQHAVTTQAYGNFSGASGATVVADRNGRAEAPRFSAGALPATYSVHAKIPPQFIGGRYYYPAGARALFEVTQVAATNDGTITSGFTGSWFNTSQSGHGFSIEVLAGTQMLAEWFVFSPAVRSRGSSPQDRPSAIAR